MSQHITHHQNTFYRGKNGHPMIFFHIKKLPGVLRYKKKIWKSPLDRGLACAKRIPALMNLWVLKWMAKTTKREKKNLCPWHCLKHKKMRGQPVNIMNKLIQWFLVTFLLFLGLNKSFSLPTGHVFFRRLYCAVIISRHDFSSKVLWRALKGRPTYRLERQKLLLERGSPQWEACRPRPVFVNVFQLWSDAV
jgi:hypothetical protein